MSELENMDTSRSRFVQMEKERIQTYLTVEHPALSFLLLAQQHPNKEVFS